MRIKLLKLYVRIRLAVDPAYRQEREKYIRNYRRGWGMRAEGYPIYSAYGPVQEAGYKASRKLTAMRVACVDKVPA